MRDEARTIDETAGVLKGPSARIYTVHVGSIARPDDRTVAGTTVWRTLPTNRQHPVSKRRDDHGVHPQRRYHVAH